MCRRDAHGGQGGFAARVELLPQLLSSLLAARLAGEHRELGALAASAAPGCLGVEHLMEVWSLPAEPVCSETESADQRKVHCFGLASSQNEALAVTVRTGRWLYRAPPIASELVGGLHPDVAGSSRRLGTFLWGL